MKRLPGILLIVIVVLYAGAWCARYTTRTGDLDTYALLVHCEEDGLSLGSWLVQVGPFPGAAACLVRDAIPDRFVEATPGYLIPVGPLSNDPMSHERTWYLSDLVIQKAEVGLDPAADTAIDDVRPIAVSAQGALRWLRAETDLPQEAVARIDETLARSHPSLSESWASALRSDELVSELRIEPWERLDRHTSEGEQIMPIAPFGTVGACPCCPSGIDFEQLPASSVAPGSQENDYLTSRAFWYSIQFNMALSDREGWTCLEAGGVET